MNQMLLAVGAVGIILLLALTRRLYEKVQNDAKKLRLFKGALACAVVLAVVGGVFALSRMGGGLAPDQLLMTNPNGDSIWTFSLGYICRNLPATAKLLLRTIPAQGALWLQGILGTTLGSRSFTASTSAGCWASGWCWHCWRQPCRCRTNRMRPAGPPHRPRCAGHHPLRCGGVARRGAELDAHQL